jgi:histidinol dehydrogenase
MIDVRRLIAEVAARDGIRVEPGDPAFALVTLNQLVLEDAVAHIGQQVRAGIMEFTEAVHKTEARAGKLLAQEVKEAAAEIRRELHQDIQNARLEAKEIVHEVHRSHTKSAMIRWGAAGAICVAAMFATGLWIGAYYLR